MQHLLAPKFPTPARPLRRSSSEFGHATTLESLEVQLANLKNCPGLRKAEVILQSILWTIAAHRKYKDMTLTLAKCAVDVTTQIKTLIEATTEAPQWSTHIAHLTEILHEIRLFVQTETQPSFLRGGALFGKTISIRCAAMERRLTSVLNDVEQCNTEIRASQSMREGVPAKANNYPICSTQFQVPSSTLMNQADIVRSGEIFSNAHDVVITGGQYYSGQICIQPASSQESDQGIVPGIRVVRLKCSPSLGPQPYCWISAEQRLARGQVSFEDISINREIHRTSMYRLHSDTGSRIVVKVYQGPRAKERAQEAARFCKKVMHPTLFHIVGVSPLHCEVPFLVFNGGFEGSLEVSIAKALEKDLRKSVILGLQTVIGLSSGLDYLRDVAYPFVNAGPQHFRAFLSLKGEVIISFDPDIAYELSDSSVNEQSSLLEVGKPLLIFHELCQQTFNAACQAHYDLKQVERMYDDTLETEGFTFFGDSYEGIASISSIPSTDISLEKPFGKFPIDGHRRELVWKSQDGKNSSLENISFEFKAFLDSLLPSSEPVLQLHHRRGRYSVRTAHRCPGYNRTEITLTPSITRSAIVSHFTPLPHEICTVCNQVVQDVELFDCICGGEDDESTSTIQCSICHKWHHQRCVDCFKSTARSFTCPDCCRSQAQGQPGSQHTPGSFNMSANAMDASISFPTEGTPSMSPGPSSLIKRNGSQGGNLVNFGRGPITSLDKTATLEGSQRLLISVLSSEAATENGNTPSGETDSKDLKEFWKQYMGIPLSGSGMLPSAEGSEVVTPSGDGSNKAPMNMSGPGPGYRQPRLTSLPAVKTPIIEAHLNLGYFNATHPCFSSYIFSCIGDGDRDRGQGPTAASNRTSSREMPDRMAIIGMDMDVGDTEDLRSYEAAVMARIAPTLNLRVRKGRGKETVAR